MPPKPRSALDKLPEATQQALWELTHGHTIEDAVALAAAPLEEGGLELETTRSALQRFYHRHAIRHLMVPNLTDTRLTIDEAAAALPVGGDKEHNRLIVEQLKSYTVQTLATGKADLDDASTILKALTSYEKQQLAAERLELDKAKAEREEEKLDLDRQRLRLEVRKAAQTVLTEQQQLAAIAADTGLSSDEQIDGVMAVLYGEEFMAALQLREEEAETT